jgi:hypothetical protein
MLFRGGPRCGHLVPGSGGVEGHDTVRVHVVAAAGQRVEEVGHCQGTGFSRERHPDNWFW